MRSSEVARRVRHRPCSRWRAATPPKGWTEWTQGFQFGSAILQFDATGDDEFLETRPRPHGRTSWRRTSRTSACTTTASTTSAPTAICWRLMTEGRDPGGCVGAALLRAGAEGSRRRAGGALVADTPMAAATSTPSTARIRCSSTRSASLRALGSSAISWATC